METQLFKTNTGVIVIYVKQKQTFREALLSCKLVTEGKNKDWGHGLLSSGYYSVKVNGRRITLTPEIPM